MNVFKNAPKKVIDHIIYEQYKKGDTIFVQGDKNEYLYFIEDGKVEVVTTSKKGQRISISIFEQGESIGVLEILNSEVQTENVIALTKCKLAKVHKTYILEWMKQDFQFTLYVIGLLQGIFNEASYFAKSLVSMTLKERVVVALHKHDKNNTLKYVSKDTLTQETGTQRRSLNRVLEELYGDGYLLYENKRFIVTNSKKLEQEANNYI